MNAQVKKIGTAQEVKKELEATIAQNGEVKKEKAPKIKLTDLVAKMIAENALISDEAKESLLSQINGVLSKATKPSVKKEIETEISKAILESGKAEGLSSEEVYDAIAPKFETVHPYRLSFNIYMALQPANIKKQEWKIAITEAHNFAPIPEKKK